MAHALAISLRSEGEVTASGTGSAVDLGALRTAAKLSLAVISVSGTDTPRVTVVVESSADGSTNWAEVARFTPAGHRTTEELALLELRRYLRVRWELGGISPAAVFAVVGEAHQVYFGRGEIERLAIPKAVIEELLDRGPSTVAECVIAGSDEVEGGLCQYTLPITKWPGVLRRRGAEIAAFLLMKADGFDPSGADQLIVKAYDDAMAWLRLLCQGKVDAPGIEDGTPDDPGTGGGSSSFSAGISSRPKRGW